MSMKHLLYRLRLWWWGELQYRTTDTMDAWGGPLETEREIYDCRGKLIGYWAYGCYDPELPYQG